MNTIIACTDFSPNANNAVQYAAALAEATKARLMLFHHFVYPVPATDLPMAFSSVFVDDATNAMEQRLQEIKAGLLKTYAIEIDCLLRSWDFSIDLETVFEDEKADLVVMGINGHSAVMNALVGSISATTIRRGKLPLLIVPPGVTYHPIEKILFPCDDHGIEEAGILKPLLRLAIHFDAYIEVLTLFDLKNTPELVPQGSLSEAKNTLEILLASARHGYSFENESAIDKGILYEAERSSADLIAMIPHHHSFWSNLLNQSKTQQVAVAIKLPLLVLGEKGLASIKAG